MRQNLEPKVWGPHAWFFLESIAMGYPTNPTPTDIEKTKLFFLSLKYVLPCSKCRNNFDKHLEDNPLTDEVLSSNETLFKWVVDMHNAARKEKKKRTNEKTFNYYMKMYTKSTFKYTIYKIIILIVALLIIGFLLKKYIL